MKSQQVLDDAQRDVQLILHNVDATVRQFYEQEFARVRKQFKDAKEGVEQQSRCLIDNASEQLASLTTEIEALKKQADVRLASFQSTQSK
jgi:hypothetical protein